MEKNFIPTIKKNLQSIIVMLVLFITSFIFYRSHMYDFECGDMGLKITGARLQTQGASAYLYTEPDSSKVIDGVVSTPLLNLLHTPFINFNSCQVKQASFWVNFVLLLLVLLFIIWLFSGVKKIRLYALAFFLPVFFLFANPFFYNLLRGQEYSLFALIFFVLLYLLKKEQYFMLGIIWVLAIAIRPLFLAGTLLVLLYFNRKIIAGLVTGAILVVLLTLLTNTMGNWKEYLVAMKQYVHELPDDASGVGIYKGEHRAGFNSSFNDCQGTLSPTGLVRFRSKFHGILLQPLQFWLLKRHKTISNTTFYSAIAGLLCLIFAGAVRLRLKKITAEKYAATLFVLYLFCEVCAPAPRGEYSFILWVFGTTLITAKANVVEIALLVIGLLAVDNVIYFKIPGMGEICMLVACIMFIFRKTQQPYYMRIWPLKTDAD